MDFKEGVHKSATRGTLFQADSQDDPEHQQGERGRWLRVLVAFLLLICLVAGGTFAYMRLRPGSTSVNAKKQGGWCNATLAVVNPVEGAPSLHSLAALSPTNIWTLGSVGQGDISSDSEHVMPLLEHWDGQRWSLVNPADTSSLLNGLLDQVTGQANQQVSLNNLAVVSADDIWAVGSVVVSQFTSNGLFLGHTLVEHWDGQQWQVVPSPDGVDRGENDLESVAAISANDVWAVGSMQANPLDRFTQTNASLLIEHWDGSRWSIVSASTVTAPQSSSSLNGITAISATDIWAVGSSGGNSTNGFPDNIPLIIHWDGHNWSTAKLPPTLNIGSLFTIKAISASDIWAVGAGSFRSPAPPLLAHWDGQQWTRATNMIGAPAGTFLTKLATSGPDDVWAVGNVNSLSPSDTTNTSRPLLEHWNGQSWQNVVLPDPQYGELFDIALVGSKIWLVGGSNDSSGQAFHTFIKTTC